MPRITEQTIEQIRSIADIQDVVGRYVQLKKRGKNWFAPCPFHNEKTGSFSVSPERQMFKCFGCGVGGSVINFMTKAVATVTPDMDLFMVADIFLKHNYKRMPVVVGDKIVGQISRRDVLRAIQDGSSHEIDKNEINGYITKEMKGSLSK